MPNVNKVLVLGGSSYVGRHLVKKLGTNRAVATYHRNQVQDGVYFDALSMGLSEIIQAPKHFTHAIVLLGDTRPEFCASHQTESYALNVASAKRIIDCLNEMKIKPVYISSEWVFDGTKGNYVESDTPNPILTYGRQKVEMEEYVQSRCDRFTIIRLAKVFGTQRGDGTLFTSWLDAIERREVIRCAQDQIFSPIHVWDAVESIIRLIQLDCGGIYHISTPKGYSRLDLLNMLLSKAKGHVPVDAKVIPCSIDDFGLLEKRPLNVSMNPDKLMRATGIQINAVEHVLEDLVIDTFLRVPTTHPQF